MKSTKVLLFAVIVLISVCIDPSTASVPIVQFSGTPITGSVPLNVTFTDQSTGSPIGWAWYFGDENYTALWTQVNASAGWMARMHHSSVVMPDGSIVLMGGDGNGGKNDTWRSTDYGATWTLVNASSGWSERYGHSSVVMPDGSIVLMGGCYGDSNCRNDTWRSTDSGATWMLMNVSSGWSGRCIHSSVAMPDGSIVLMGGFTDDPFLINDVWRSMDYGATWTLVNASPGWSERRGHSSVVMPDGTIVLLGGEGSPDGGSSLKNDTWKSIDNGATWTRMTANAEWSGRDYHSSVVMPDGSIMLMGGWSFDDLSLKNDTWRSTDNGTTWTLVNASSGWSGRQGHSSVVMPDGSIVLIGGEGSIFSDDYMNDVWRFMQAGSSAQNPSHTYTVPGIYNVSLQAYNAVGYSSIQKAGYINATVPVAPVAMFTGIPTSGSAQLTVQFNDTSTGFPTSWNWSFTNVTGNHTQVWFSTAQNPNHTFGVGNFSIVLNASNSAGYNLSTQATFINVTGGAVVKGNDGIAIFRNSSGYWYFDHNLDGIINKSFRYGGSGDRIVKGDWDGDGKDGIAIFRPSTGYWYFDYNLDGVVDKFFRYGGSTDRIIVGKWQGPQDGIAIFRPSTGYWYFDYNLDGIIDKSFRYGGSTDQIIKGDWDGDGKDGIAIFRPSTGYWYFDYNLDGIVDKSFRYGGSTDLIITGKWQGTLQDGIAIFRPAAGFWYFDYNLDGIVDDSFRYGGVGDQIIKGDWQGTGKDGIAIFRPSSGYWYFDNNLDGIVDKAFRYGGNTDQIIAGKWA